MLNFDPWVWPNLEVQDHDVNKVESPCPKNATNKILN